MGEGGRVRRSVTVEQFKNESGLLYVYESCKNPSISHLPKRVYLHTYQREKYGLGVEETLDLFYPGRVLRYTRRIVHTYIYST